MKITKKSHSSKLAAQIAAHIFSLTSTFSHVHNDKSQKLVLSQATNHHITCRLYKIINKIHTRCIATYPEGTDLFCVRMKENKKHHRSRPYQVYSSRLIFPCEHAIIDKIAPLLLSNILTIKNSSYLLYNGLYFENICLHL